MNTDRRSFLRKNLFFGSSLLLAGSLDAIASTAKSINTLGVNQSQLNIMYTNDLKGRVNAAYQDFGGLKEVHYTMKNDEVSSLLFDAGGFLNTRLNSQQQLKGIDLMNKINYHGVNLSAVDLNEGLDKFKALLPYISFPLLSCNYHFEDADLRKTVKPYQILKYGKFKVGVTGVGEKTTIAGLTVSNAQTALNRVTRILKEKHQCDVVVCLAHLGFDKKSKTNNKSLAESSLNVDLVIGGDAKNSQSQLWVLKNKSKHDVLLSNNFSKGLSTAKVSLGFSAQMLKSGIDLKREIPGLACQKSKHSTINELVIQNKKNNI